MRKRAGVAQMTLYRHFASKDDGITDPATCSPVRRLGAAKRGRMCDQNCDRLPALREWRSLNGAVSAPERERAGFSHASRSGCSRTGCPAVRTRSGMAVARRASFAEG
jgi:hypothetical protein